MDYLVLSLASICCILFDFLLPSQSTPSTAGPPVKPTNYPHCTYGDDDDTGLLGRSE